jgi:predicted PurR-regulated permease PerM
VLLVVTIIFAVTGAVGWVLTRQLVDLATKLPDYKGNIQTKLRSIKVPTGGAFTKFSETVEELKKDLPGAETPTRAVMQERLRRRWRCLRTSRPPPRRLCNSCSM